MFDPAPEYVADKQENKTQAYDFLIRVRNAALHYEVYGDNRIELINKCCDYLENLQDRLHTKIWPKGQREPIEEFQDVFQLLIYAIADSGFLFDSNGYFFDEPAAYHTEKLLLPSPWDTSVKSYHEVAFAMRRRNYAHLELQAIRKHLDEHNKQSQQYETYAMSEEISTANQTQCIIDMMTRCSMHCHIAIYPRDYTLNEIQQIAAVRNTIRQDRILKKVEPFMMFMLLSGKVRCSNIQSAADVKSLLKPNKTFFQQRNVAEDCKLFSEIIKWYNDNGDIELTDGHRLFDPYALINGFKQFGDLKMTKQEHVNLAHLCEDCFREPTKKKEFAGYTQKLHGVEIGEIMKAIFQRIDAQNRSIDDTIQPREWNATIKTLQKAEILPLNVSPGLKGSKLLNMIGKKYFIEQYSFAWEAFWLITQYTPPPLFDWKQNYTIKGWPPRSYELYALCAEHLTTALDFIYGAFAEDWDQLSLYPELRFDIAKVQRIFADPKKTAPLRKQLLIDMGFWKIQGGGKNLPQLLADKCWSAFEELSASSKDAKLKSLRQYPEIMKYAMADEVMRQLCAETYAKVFHLLVSMNQYLWPIT